MKRIAFLQILAVLTMLINSGAAAQRSYTFDEACRNAGWTTGPCAPPRQQAQSLGCVPLVGHSFHAQPSSENCLVTTVSPSLDIEFFVELIGLPNIGKINELGLTIGRTHNQNNAHATFFNGGRVLMIDPVWAKSGPEAYLIVGHEAGHHFCGHTLPDYEGRPKEKELEADRFAGASIARFEVYHGKPFFAEALKAAERLFVEPAHRTHPSKAARMEAITEGYRSGSTCGNLAPALPGFSSRPR